MQLISALLVLMATLGFAKPGWAQDGCPDFAEAAGLSEQQFEVLATSRSISVEEMQTSLLGDMGAIKAYLSVPPTPADAGQRALAYYVAAGESVCLYYLSSQGDEQSFRLSESAAALRSLVDETLVAVSHAAAPLERRAQLRDGVEASRAAKSLARDVRPPADPAPLLARLSEVLFPEDMRDEVERLSGLTVVPALNIGTVPFAGLDPNGDGSPLSESTAINVEAALRDVLAGRIFGIGEGVAPQSITGDPDATTDPQWMFPRLPGAAREAEAIARRFGTVAVIGPDATVDEVAPKMAAAEYIHVAAHGFSDPHDPIDGSFLALTGGRLTARAIQEMRFGKNPLVVLSACQTGLGGTLDAGIIGLARAFLLAGSSSVVASLWNVDDEATSWIMSRFAENIPSHPPAEALRLAQQAARQKWPDPKIWAAFIVFGSRTVSFEAAGQSAVPLAVDAEFTVKRQNTGQGELADLAARTAVAPGDAIYISGVNRSDTPVDVHVTYVAADGEATAVEAFRVGPSETFDKGLVRITDSTVGHEWMVATFEQANAMSPVAEAQDLSGLSPLATVLALVGVDALGGAVPGRGIAPLSQPGPQRAGALIEATLSSEDGSRRRAVAILSLDVRPQ
jgi:hypothetical protein